MKSLIRLFVLFFVVSASQVFAQQTYTIRSTGPAGGKVFYVENTKEHGLEAAPNDQSSAQLWSNISAKIGTTGTEIGTGKANTATIIAQLGHTNSAAKLCKDLVVGPYKDWFLPSKEELEQMYVNLQSGIDENGISYVPVDGFANLGGYWSSSEHDRQGAWNQSFYSGSQKGYHKDTNDNVRCVRAF